MIKISQKILLKSQNRMQLLASTTGAEAAACRILDAMGVQYMKQYPISTGRKIYYADIYIPKIRLVLEIDGGYHYTTSQKKKDENRSAGIRRLGMHIYRLSNHDARDPQKIRAKILRLIKVLPRG